MLQRLVGRWLRRWRWRAPEHRDARDEPVGPSVGEAENDPSIFYGTVVDNGNMAVEVKADGRVIGSFSPSPYARRKEGTFEIQIDRALVRRLRLLLRQSTYLTSKPTRTVLRPGEQLLSVAEALPDEWPRPTSWFPFDEVPASLGPFRTEMDALVSKLK